jgi:N-acetylmuramic acid 6-phosphate etherase
MSNLNKVIDELRALETEAVNPKTIEIDRLSALEITRTINDEDKTVAETVAKALPQIAQAAEHFAVTLKRGGRVFYVGAGTSGRLGVLDAAECPPTYGTDPKQIIGVISGGYDTLILSKEGVEDDTEAAVADMKQHSLTSFDMVIGIAASRRTPYTISALQYAKSIGCQTAFIICNPPSSEKLPVDILISLPVGPEVITGSTRMKSGTAQKMALNLISTTAMILLGKTYGNRMVDLQAKSEKLAARSRRLLMELLSIDMSEADMLLAKANGSVKLALVMHVKECSIEEAQRLLVEANGFLRRVLGDALLEKK